MAEAVNTFDETVCVYVYALTCCPGTAVLALQMSQRDLVGFCPDCMQVRHAELMYKQVRPHALSAQV